MRAFLFLAFVVFTSAAASAQQAAPAPFEIRDGDRVLLLGDTLLERENSYGALETRMHQQFPDRRFTVRNLSWAGDTPRGWSRASFDAPEKGWERLKEHIALVKPTVVFLGYGMAASLQELTDRSGDATLNPDPARYGSEPMSAARFKQELAQLMDAIEEIARTGGSADAAAPRTGGGVNDRASLSGTAVRGVVSPAEASIASTKAEVAIASSKPNPRTPEGGRVSAPGAVRFVLLSPIQHEDLRDLRATKFTLPDPAGHNELIAQYSSAIGELAKERGAVFVNLASGWKGAEAPLTQNGIHLTESGYESWGSFVKESIGWRDAAAAQPAAERQAALRAAVLRKNELFFHRFRPANSTYLFGFRKHEQGQNAVEIEQFDPLIEAADVEIARIKGSIAQGGAAAAGVAEPSRPAPAASQKAPAAESAVPLPQFTVAEGYQIELWAENPLLEKPTQMNWDAQGRLWVCSSSLYPQIAPGEPAHDKILILEDTTGDGKADKSTVFAEGLLIPTGVEPDLGGGFTTKNAKDAKGEEKTTGSEPSRSSRLRGLNSACYVGQSTELLHFTDTDGDGNANAKRIVFSGFGTEDTHHIIHTLHWGPDGRLYFNQSVYIHSHIETPYGMVRLNSGGIFAYDPKKERLEVFARGWWNSWGHQMDKWGQSFATDGAGNTGISWVIPGAIYQAYEGGRRVAPGISPGSYPKFCGLELLYSPHFPAEWQGNAITCDFRAHRIVRFAIEDLSLTTADAANAAVQNSGAKPTEAPPSNVANAGAAPLQNAGSAGYLAKEQPDLVRTNDLAFRPIDVKLGPDGALYVADWSNPIIQHGEVDFRDKRRDKHRGRIWRISKKDTPLVKWAPLVEKGNTALLEKLSSESLWEKEQARRTVLGRYSKVQRGSVSPGGKAQVKEMWDELKAWKSQLQGAEAMLLGESLFNAFRHNDLEAIRRLLASDAAPVRAAATRLLASRRGAPVAAEKQLDPSARTAAVEMARRRSSQFRQLVDELKAKHHANPQELLDELIEKANHDWTPQERALALDELLEKAKHDANPRVLLEQATHDANPRVRLEAIRGLPRLQIPRSAELVLDTIPKPAADPFLEYAAWLSINELAKPWTEAILSGDWKIEGREAQLAYGLSAIEPALASKVLATVFAEREIPRDGSGPWLELIGRAGGPAELAKLWNAVAQKTLTSSATVRALDALSDAARVRKVRPASSAAEPSPAASKDAAAALVGFFEQQDPKLKAAAARLLGNWRVEHAAEQLAKLGAREGGEVRTAAFEALSGLGGKVAVQQLTALIEPANDLAVRRAALTSLAQVQLDAAVKHAPAVLAAISDEKQALETWRALLQAKGAADAFAVALPKDLPKAAAAAGLRAARETGRRGEKLVSFLAPIAGVSGPESKPLQSYGWMVDLTKRDGDPARGELIYRRLELGCVTCHAIGGAGGKVGPDMTSLGASAPLDYIIESVLDPAAKVKEGFNAVSYTLRDNTVVMGILARETANEIYVRDVAGNEQPVVKANIVSKTDVGSIMAPGLVDQLTDRERWELFAFLGELGKPGGFDASKGKVARVWWLSSAPDAAPAPDAQPVFTLVDGRLPRDILAEGVQPVVGSGEFIYATARFQSSGKTNLKIIGAKQAWLNGKPLSLEGEVASELATGEHRLTVQLDPKALPEVLIAGSEGARFLGN